MKNQYFQIKYGFSVSDTITVAGSEVEKAIYAQIKGVPVQIGDQYVNGKNIIAIRPAYYKHTGWHDWYEPTDGEDWKQIKRDCPNYDGLIEAYKNRVAKYIANNQTHLIGKSDDILEITEPSKNSELDDDIESLSNIFKLK
jgi:hypothetical protein